MSKFLNEEHESWLRDRVCSHIHFPENLLDANRMIDELVASGETLAGNGVTRFSCTEEPEFSITSYFSSGDSYTSKPGDFSFGYVPAVIAMSTRGCIFFKA